MLTEAREMFIVDLKSPIRAVRPMVLRVKVCPKTVWAVRNDGRRYLIGSSAFQTKAAAERCRRALLQKVVDDTYQQHYRPAVWENAKRALATVVH